MREKSRKGWGASFKYKHRKPLASLELKSGPAAQHKSGNSYLKIRGLLVSFSGYSFKMQEICSGFFDRLNIKNAHYGLRNIFTNIPNFHKYLLTI
jgi:hypothetical protein